jgi:hypothetical protein
VLLHFVVFYFFNFIKLATRTKKNIKEEDKKKNLNKFLLKCNFKKSKKKNKI